MQGMNNITLNEDVYEQLKDSCEALDYQEPDINIKSDMTQYIENLKRDDDHIREKKLKTWIKGHVQPILTAWERKYAGGDNILNNIHTEITNLDNIKDEEQINIDNLERKITTELQRKERKETQIQKAETISVGNETIDLKYEKNKASILVIFSILIAFATYTLFVKNQISMDWAVKAPSAKLTLVKEMVKGGEDAYINTYAEQYFQTDDEKTMSNQEINKEKAYIRIKEEDLPKAPIPGFLQTLKYNPSLFLLALSAFLLILVGKVTAIVYEKLKSPSWMFYILYGLAAIVLPLIIVTSSSLTSKEVERDGIEKTISPIKVELNKKEKELEAYDAEDDAEDPSYLSLVKEKEAIHVQIKEQEAKAKAIDDEITSYTFYVVLLLMFAEVIMGSIAWITYSEYIHKKMQVLRGGESKINQLVEEKNKIENEIRVLKDTIKEKESKIKKAQELENKIATLSGAIHSTSQIHNIANQHLKALIAKGNGILQEARTRWDQEK